MFSKDGFEIATSTSSCMCPIFGVPLCLKFRVLTNWICSSAMILTLPSDIDFTPCSIAGCYANWFMEITSTSYYFRCGVFLDDSIASINVQTLMTQSESHENEVSQCCCWPFYAKSDAQDWCFRRLVNYALNLVCFHDSYVSKVTFICGRSGVCALGAVVAKIVGDEQLLDHYLAEFRKIELPDDLPCELLYGRAGFLWSCSFLNEHIGKGIVLSSTTRRIVSEIIKAGRGLGKGRCPLMYEWHGKRYWGAAHGLAGIMHVLMDMELKPDEQEDVKATLRYMIKGRLSSGNYPSSEGSESDCLVHWCHGAPGVALTLAKAAQVFGDKDFLQAAIDAGEVVWKRGVIKRVGICHGISGNTYFFLTLYRLTGNALYLYRAKAFASFLEDRALGLIAEGMMHGGDRPFSLFEGIGGMAYLFLDMQDPLQARFPAYEK